MEQKFQMESLCSIHCSAVELAGAANCRRHHKEVEQMGNIRVMVISPLRSMVGHSPVNSAI
jgi:hypothetical protein